jgi:hypothetical protein
MAGSRAATNQSETNAAAAPAAASRPTARNSGHRGSPCSSAEVSPLVSSSVRFLSDEGRDS